MKILITGTSGFIGSNLLSALSNDNSFEVYALTRNLTNRQSIDEKAHYIECDLSTNDFVVMLPKGIDVVVHLAQSNNYRLFPEKAEDIFAINANSTLILLEWSRRNNVKQFLFASSGNVYKRQEGKLNEEDACLPLDFYGRSKYIGELLADSYKEYLDIKILRLFGVYGPGQNGMVISNIISKIKNSEVITLASRIGLQFTPLYIDDCISMFIAILKGTSKETIYNLAGNEVIDLYTISSIIATELGLNPNLVFNDDQPVFMNGDCSLFMNSYKYEHDFNLKDGLKRTLTKLTTTNET